MMYEVRHFLPAQNKLGEGAVWSPAEQALYWVDIENRRFSRFFLATQQYEVFEVGDMVGVLALRASAGLIMATRHGFARWDFQTRQLTYLADPEAGQEQRRFNDGAIDCRGRFWAGTMNMTGPYQANGVLYRFDPDGQVQVMETGLILPNGLVWSLDNRQMYLTDSEARMIYVYDFEAESGAITNRRPFIATPDEPGVPDGLTIDDEGFLWSARWGGGKVVRYDPTGKVVRELSVPALHPTSCAFGGQDRNELFITTAWTALDEAGRQTYPLAGDLFRVQTEVTGSPRPTFPA